MSASKPFHDTDALRSIVIANAYRLYVSTIVGNPAPSTARLHEELINPKPGDLVIETSTIYDPARDAARFGRLLRVVNEPIQPVEEYEGATERAYYVEADGGREHRWVNASFVKVVEARSGEATT